MRSEGSVIKPSPTDRAYYPTTTDINNHMYRAKRCTAVVKVVFSKRRTWVYTHASQCECTCMRVCCVCVHVYMCACLCARLLYIEMLGPLYLHAVSEGAGQQWVQWSHFLDKHKIMAVSELTTLPL